MSSVETGYSLKRLPIISSPSSSSSRITSGYSIEICKEKSSGYVIISPSGSNSAKNTSKVISWRPNQASSETTGDTNVTMPALSIVIRSAYVSSESLNPRSPHPSASSSSLTARFDKSTTKVSTTSLDKLRTIGELVSPETSL